jgi:hypothetical protein
MIPATRIKKPGRPEEKRKKHRTLDAGGRRVATIVAIAGLDRLQAAPKWEMSGKRRSDA